MLSRAVRVARIRGIEVRLDPTLLVLAVLIVWTLGAQFSAEHGRTTALVMATCGMLLFLGSIFAHELAHALEARHRGVEVEGITLLIFGGVTQMHAHGARPRDEFAIAAVGPFVSLLCGAVFGLISTGASHLPPTVGTPAAELAGLLALLNVLLAVFNLVPGAPLDGGRVLRAGLWWLIRDRSTAIRWAARAGQLFGLILIGYGFFVLMQAPQALVVALLYSAVGAFLVWAASSEYRNSRLDDLYSGTTVRGLLPLLAREPGAPEPTAPGRAAPTGASPANAGSPDAPDPANGLPHLQLDADLHDLVEAFQGSASAVVLYDGEHRHGQVSEKQVARAIARLRRRPRPARQPGHHAEAPS